MKEEIWKWIPGFTGKYQVSSYGRVKSIARYRKGSRGSIVFVPEKFLKPKIDKDGYCQYALCTGEHKQMKHYKAHRLVAMAFIPNPLNLPIINHKDENRANNSVDNLEWCDYSYNRNYGTCPSKFNCPVIYNDVFYESIREAERKTGEDHRRIKRLGAVSTRPRSNPS